MTFTTFDKQSNACRTAVESKSNRSCNYRLTSRILTEVVATSAGVHPSLPAALVHLLLKSPLRRIRCRRRTEVADLQLGEVLGEVLK